jgi:hypothetical protein
LASAVHVDAQAVGISLHAFATENSPLWPWQRAGTKALTKDEMNALVRTTGKGH